MSVTQTVEIPASHRLIIDVPREVPTGRAILTFRSIAEAPLDIKARKTTDNWQVFDSGRRIDYMEAIKRCDGLFKRLGINLSSDEFLEMRRKDKELEDRLDQQ